MASKGEPKKEDMGTAALAIFACVAVMSALIWLSASHKIVVFWTPKLYMLAKLWEFIPIPEAGAELDAVRESATRFWQSPRDVGVGEWIAFFDSAARPATMLATLVVAAFLVRTVMRAQPNVKREMKPQELIEELSHVFTGTAPILHLRKALVQDKDPYWRRQTFPHEVLLKELVDGLPLVQDDQMVTDRVRSYFQGLETELVQGPEGQKIRVPRVIGGRTELRKRATADGKSVTYEKLIGGRRVSRMLGIQVVDLLNDRHKKVVFADRFSSVGKVMFGLLCAHAFGEAEGVADYEKAHDQLNNSARGVPHGFANLTVAQWIFDKYRLNPMAERMFAIHHWEYTYLFELFFQAKFQGKCPDSEFLWLKPMNRILFYVLNTVGRYTPHTESAAAFSHHVFERRVARREAIPLTNDLDGDPQHVIFVETAIKGLELEWERWRDGTGDEDEWWKSKAMWERISGANFDMPLPGPPPIGIAGETPFDRTMSADAARRQAEADAESAALAAREKSLLDAAFDST